MLAPEAIDLLRKSLREQLKNARAAEMAAFQHDGKAETLTARLTRHVDQALITAWQTLQLPPQIALVAVGGYGRGELFPYSDCDFLILLDGAPDAALTAQLEQLVQLSWDLGLEIGHSIRTVEECLSEAQADITVQTCLLEARLVCGNPLIYAQLQRRYFVALDPAAFFQAKMLEMQQRHVKYEDTPFSLEPNCKESPGGMRDLQVILWVAKAAGLGNSWRELATRGLITDAEASTLLEKEHGFKDIRARLHIQAGRREDRLLFDVQTPIALSMGFQNTGSGQNALRASENLMQRYYWAAKSVTLLNTILLQNIEALLFPQPSDPRPLNPRFDDVGGLIDIHGDDTFIRHPPAMLEVFLLMSEHQEIKGMTARTMRGLWHARKQIDADFRRNPVNRALFLKILQTPQGITHTLRRMNQTNILGRYLPAFRGIVGQMQHDLFHVYTVDQHIMMVVRNVRRFTMTEHAHEYPFCSQLMANFEKPWLLYVGALFHDIAKGRGGDHSILGKADARQFCVDHNMLAEDTELVVFLVEQHLTMSQVAQKQDLSDPDVVMRFAALVGDERHLTALYLLTVCDIRGTSPKVWNAWKGKLLEDLYRLTLRVLGGDAPSVDRELINHQQEALAALRLFGLPPGAHLAFWKQLDVAYFLRNDASDIAWQTRSLYDKLDSGRAVVKCRIAPHAGGLQVVVYTPDRADLFARICSYFDKKNFSILDAKIHTTHDGYALDTFLVTETTFEKNYRDIISLVEHELAELLQSQAELAAPDKARTGGHARLSRLSRTFPLQPSVDLRPDERGQYYLLSITANDRNGLLYAIANVLTKYRINLHTAKVMTLGERVEDVFLVDGQALNNIRTQIQFESELLDALRI